MDGRCRSRFQQGVNPWLKVSHGFSRRASGPRRRVSACNTPVLSGEPPYSVGQGSANDDNANQSYPHLDATIRETYAARSTATNKNSLYDSYIRAIRWASLRIGDRGVIGYVSNGGWIDSNTTDGMRLTLAEEFSDIHVYNLRGNQRTAGEQSRKEGGKIFGGGSRATIAITVLVKDPARTGPATIHYTDIGDYLTREDKLATIADASTVTNLPATHLTPNEHGDWLSQRSDDFDTFLALGDKDGGQAIFGLYSGGLKTNRDAWCYNFSRTAVETNARRLIATYEQERQRGHVAKEATRDATRIAWSGGLSAALDRDQAIIFRPQAMRSASYRPFAATHAYFSKDLNERRYRLSDLFASPRHDNLGFYALNPGAAKPFSVLATASIPDLAFYGSNAGQFFARWRYEKVEDEGRFTLDVGQGEVVDGYRRIDNITDDALGRFQGAYGDQVTKDDIFFYCYGLLHSPDYRETYAADLKKMLPRIPLVIEPAPYIDAGRRLAELHLGYEAVTPYPLDGLDVAGPAGDAAYEFFAVTKMAFAKTRDPQTEKLVADRSRIVYNSKITLSGIPQEAYRYMLGSRSAIEWIIDRYQIKTDKASGIVNDPNDWSREVGDPRYILDLLARIVTVSLETMAIVDALPSLEVRGAS